MLSAARALKHIHVRFRGEQVRKVREAQGEQVYVQ
jgi:hypothetical protein